MLVLLTALGCATHAVQSDLTVRAMPSAAPTETWLMVPGGGTWKDEKDAVLFVVERRTGLSSGTALGMASDPRAWVDGVDYAARRAVEDDFRKSYPVVHVAEVWDPARPGRGSELKVDTGGLVHDATVRLAVELMVAHGTGRGSESVFAAQFVEAAL